MVVTQWVAPVFKLMALSLLLAVPAQAFELSGTVTRALDGDTVEIQVDGKPIKLRLDSIDAPEHDQEFGKESKTHLEQLCLNQYVTASGKKKDAYRRYLSTVTAAGVCVNQQMVKDGFAWHYCKYSTHPEYGGAESEAKEFKRGLWAGQKPISPWNFRALKKMGDCPKEKVPYSL